MISVSKGRAVLASIVATTAVALVAPAAADAAPAPSGGLTAPVPAADPAPVFCQYTVTYTKSTGLPVRARPSTTASVVYLARTSAPCFT